ncbi:hypothetical protein M5D96_007966 [Drosophila gunungcola]|uniref:Uncharacterized protein n=1 Tax=Drosophila gunungcola TaxID=103775 RepID=A0A9P9YLM7_9MUSC|nr:hypothetical protein M5D96_007966 [Drosophila gunungcola]
MQSGCFAAQRTAFGLGRVLTHCGGGGGTGTGTETGLVRQATAHLVVKLLLLLLLMVMMGAWPRTKGTATRSTFPVLMLLLLVVQGDGHAGRQIRDEGTAGRRGVPGPGAAAQGRRYAGPASARPRHAYATAHARMGRQVKQARRHRLMLRSLMLDGRCHLHLLPDVVGHGGHRSGRFLRHVLLTAHAHAHAHSRLRTAAIWTGQGTGRSCQGATCAGIAQRQVLQGKRGLTREQLVQFKDSHPQSQYTSQSRRAT